MRIAIIGSGRMGHVLAERLLDTGHTVRVWNRTPGRTTPYGRKGPASCARRTMWAMSEMSSSLSGRRREHPRGGDSER
ncbi:NAD(P)-binding domain-containing protein [Nocardia paucivorans]|uniref:NAD(P)-binding domain-containing protein n=1 Tax=Nocardia paucivorans TaxID=114259 RepID=UPI000A05CAB8|nr:NAD(P)-binding domain-containing protein [Nocardia paucivorans]